MTGGRALTTAAAALLLGVLPLVIAHGEHGEHGDQHGGDSVEMEQGAPPESYWRLSEHTVLMYWHIGLEILAWFVVLPIGRPLELKLCPFTIR